MIIRKLHRRSPPRTGAVAVEFAVTSPLLFLLLFGALELGHANMVLNATEAAAFEGARAGITPGATAANCILKANHILNISGIKQATVEVLPADLGLDSQAVELKISVPYQHNTIVAPLFTKQLQIDRSCRLTRERP